MIEALFLAEPRNPQVTRRPQQDFRLMTGWAYTGLAALLVLAAGAARGQEPDKKFAREYQHAFKAEPPNPADIRKMGPGNAECVKFEPEGLRITLPAGVAGTRPGTGVATGFGVGGDFEITVRYEILQEPEPEDAADQTRVALVVVLDKPNPNQYLASLNRRVVPGDGAQYFSWLTLGPADTGKRHLRARPTQAKSGRLRLARDGNDLSYLAAEGDSAFKLLDKFPLGPEDVKEVRIVGSTGGEKAALDVRVRDLRVRAAALLKPPELLAPTPEYAKEYYHSFKGNPAKAPGWDFHGPDAVECVRFEREGLRISMPAGWKGERPGTGVRADFGVKGDFEITMGFEILKEPDPAELGKTGTRLTLSVVKNTAHFGTPHSEIATLSRSISGKCGTIFVTWMRRRKPADDDDEIRAKIYPTTAKSGRLRLVRSGAELFYLKAEGADDTFKVLTKFTFGAEDLLHVDIVASTGGENATLDARITDIRIRAQALPGAPATDSGPAGALAENAPQGPKREWLTTTLLLGAAVLVLFGTVAGVQVLRRRRRPAAPPPAEITPAESNPVSTAIAARCAGCGKKLKVRGELAGKKVKCPECGKAVLVPAAKTSAADGDS